MSEHRRTRRGVLKAAGGISAAMAFGGAGVLATASAAAANAASDDPLRMNGTIARLRRA